MGILSEIDMMNRDAEDDAFEVSSDSETVDSFSEEFEPVEPPKADPQAEDAEEARKKAEAREKLPERVDALETANDDIILMMADLIGG